MEKVTQEQIADCYSLSDICRKYFRHVNGATLRKAKKLIEDNKLDTGHFDGGRSKKIKYTQIEKKCPVCGASFKAQLDHPKEKTTCSHACSNTYFRSGENHPNWKDGDGSTPDSGYRKVCFDHHSKACVVCGEDIIVAVHHIDENNLNNDPKNLVPLCPTHHSYVHSRHKHLIEDKVNAYLLTRWGTALAI